MCEGTARLVSWEYFKCDFDFLQLECFVGAVLCRYPERDKMGSIEKKVRHVDVLIVGGGPVGTSLLARCYSTYHILLSFLPTTLPSNNPSQAS